ncbi:hypothetical protein Tco_0919073, partial [Tanacetum coccineum]
NKFSKHNVYSTKKILGVKSVSVKKLHGYGHLEEIMVKRAGHQFYKFKEGDSIDLHLNDIEDMLLLAVQHKLFHLIDNAIVDFVVALCMFTRILVIKKHVEDLQLGVESYQKKLNITPPQQTLPDIEFKELYTPSHKPPGQNRRDLPKDIPLDRIEVLRYDEKKGSDTKVLTMTMEILPKPTSNKLYGSFSRVSGHRKVEHEIDDLMGDRNLPFHSLTCCSALRLLPVLRTEQKVAKRFYVQILLYPVGDDDRTPPSPHLLEDQDAEKLILKVNTRGKSGRTEAKKK